MEIFGYEITINKVKKPSDDFSTQLVEFIYFNHKPLTGAQIAVIRDAYEKLYTSPNLGRQRNNAISCMQELTK